MKNSLHAWDLALALIANGKTPFDPERIGKNTQRKRADPKLRKSLPCFYSHSAQCAFT